MTVIDSSGWIEFFSEGPLASHYEKHLGSLSEIVVPTIVLYEVYKKYKRESGEQGALTAVFHMQKCRIVPLTEELSLEAADLSLQYGLAMADAIVYASALQEKAKLITSDKALKNLPQVVYYSKSS